MKILIEVLKRILSLIFICPRTVLDDGTLIVASDENELHARVAQHELATKSNIVSISIDGITYSRKEV